MNSRIEQLLEFIEEDAQDVFSRYALALEYWNLNQLEDAKQSFLNVLAIDKDYLAVYYHLGKNYQAMGDFDSAKSTFENGVVLAHSQKNLKTKAELLTAIDELEDL